MARKIAFSKLYENSRKPVNDLVYRVAGPFASTSASHEMESMCVIYANLIHPPESKGSSLVIRAERALLLHQNVCLLKHLWQIISIERRNC